MCKQHQKLKTLKQNMIASSQNSPLHLELLRSEKAMEDQFYLVETWQGPVMVSQYLLPQSELTETNPGYQVSNCAEQEDTTGLTNTTSRDDELYLQVEPELDIYNVGKFLPYSTSNLPSLR